MFTELVIFILLMFNTYLLICMVSDLEDLKRQRDREDHHD